MDASRLNPDGWTVVATKLYRYEAQVLNWQWVEGFSPTDIQKGLDSNTLLVMHRKRHPKLTELVVRLKPKRWQKLDEGRVP